MFILLLIMNFKTFLTTVAISGILCSPVLASDGLTGVLAFDAGDNGGLNISQNDQLDFLPLGLGTGNTDANNGFALIEDGGDVGGDFLSFVGQSGLIKDLISTTSATSFLDFPSFSFDLTSMSSPVFSQLGRNTNVLYEITGVFTEKSSGIKTKGYGSFSGVATNRTIAQTQLAISTNRGANMNWSGTLEATKQVNESSSLLGLALIGLIPFAFSSPKGSEV
ncbi:MAG: hypothetical protein ACRCU6_08140 [Fusobacteriaceae bacterium]